MNTLAEKLANAWVKKELIDIKSLQSDFIPKTREDSHKIQQELHNFLKRPIKGWKIGAVTKEIQKEEGFDGPMIGRIISDTILKSPIEIKYKDVPHCMLECEFALKFLEDTRMVPGVENKTDNYEMYISLELCATRINPDSKKDYNKQDQMYLAIADNGGAGAIVIGEKIKDFKKLNLNSIEVHIDNNGKISKPFFTGHKRPHPTEALKCITREFKNNPVTLKKNDWLMSGSIIQPIKVTQGDHFKIDFKTLGKIDIKFV
tara:strand:+ start:964 stop:1743 length:780 start_codon:yes stop_codon:yes gene_type:complete